MRLKIPSTSSVEIWFATASTEEMPPLQHSRMRSKVCATHRLSTGSSDTFHSVGSVCGIVSITMSQTMDPMRYTVARSELVVRDIPCSR